MAQKAMWLESFFCPEPMTGVIDIFAKIHTIDKLFMTPSTWISHNLSLD